MFTSLSIRAKITIVVSFLLIAMTGMGLLAVRNMRAINANAVDIQTNWLPSMKALGELRAGVITYRNVIRAHLLAETLEEKLATEKALEGVVARNNKIRAGYEPLITSPEERAIYQEWAQNWELYKAGTQQVMALSRASVGKIPHDASELNSKTVNPIGVKSDALLDKDIDLNNRGADQAGKDATANYDTAFLMLAVILGVAAVLGIGIGVYLVRDVSSGIASIVKPMQALGNGDLTAVVPHQGETTEIGSMADALQVFKQALIDKKAADEAAMVDAEEKIRRGERVNTITRDFEAMIGEIVCRRLRRSLKRLPARSPRPPSARSSSPPWSQRLRKKPPPTCSRWPRPPKRWRPRSTRSAARFRILRPLPGRPWNRRARPMTASASWPRPRLGSATWSN